MAGEQRNKFRKAHLSRSAKNPYQDPTFLTFQIIFDTTSPLFNKEVAVKSLREQYNEPKKAAKLEAFVDTMLMINREMPWYWGSISGVDRAFDYDFTSPYWGGDDALLTIECNESINLAITGLMDMYKEAVYNLDGWTQVLPSNYKRFDMTVIVSEVREIRTVQPANGNIAKDINSDITADNKPMFSFTFQMCQFQNNSGKETFETLTNASPENPKPKINIKYENIVKNPGSYLQGISDAQIPEGPGVGTEAAAPTLAERAASALNDAQSTVMDGIKDFNPVRDFTRPNNVYGSVLDQAFQSAVNELDGVAGGLGNVADNLFKTGLGAVNRETQNTIASLKDNIFGLGNTATVGAALRQGAVNSILPMINNTGGGSNENLGNTYGK